MYFSLQAVELLNIGKATPPFVGTRVFQFLTVLGLTTRLESMRADVCENRSFQTVVGVLSGNFKSHARLSFRLNDPSRCETFSQFELLPFFSTGKILNYSVIRVEGK